MRDASFIGSDYRANFKQVIAKRSDLVVFEGGRMKPAGAGLVATHQAGLILGKVTATGLYAPYSDAASDGTEVAVGVLSEIVITDEFGNDSECVIIKNGILLKDLLIGYDANALADLKGSLSTEHGTNLIKINL